MAVYSAAIAHLAEHYRAAPDTLSEEQVRRYLLLRSESLQKNSLRPIVGGLKFFYRVTVPRDWKSLQAIRIPKVRTLPAVLVPQRVWQLIEATRTPYLQTFFRVSYTCGLRPGDARHLTVADIDRDRMLLQLRTTKGRDQRCLPLPQATLDALRAYWRTHRQPRWLFPSRADLKQIATAEQPISQRSIQRGFALVVRSLGWTQVGLCPHPLRHSYAPRCSRRVH